MMTSIFNKVILLLFGCVFLIGCSSDEGDVNSDGITETTWYASVTEEYLGQQISVEYKLVFLNTTGYFERKTPNLDLGGTQIGGTSNCIFDRYDYANNSGTLFLEQNCWIPYSGNETFYVNENVLRIRDYTLYKQ